MSEWTISRFVANVISCRTFFLDFLIKEQLITSQMLCDENQAMVLDEKRGKLGFGIYRCQKKHTDGKARAMSRYKSTWFENCHTFPEKALLITFCFAIDWEFSRTLSECRIFKDATSASTVSDWYAYCREIIVEWMLNKQDMDGKIGGFDVEVEIDESKFGKRKGNVGRTREGTWIFGLIERKSKRFRLEVCPDNKRDAETLLPMIQKHVLPGTTIFSDMWRAYSDLDKSGFYHFTVNHSKNFVDPDTGAHTQNIEAAWRPLKLRLRNRHTKQSGMADHLIEYLFRRMCRIDELDPFNIMLDIIRHSYPLC